MLCEADSCSLFREQREEDSFQKRETFPAALASRKERGSTYTVHIARWRHSATGRLRGTSGLVQERE